MFITHCSCQQPPTLLGALSWGDMLGVQSQGDILDMQSQIMSGEVVGGEA